MIGRIVVAFAFARLENHRFEVSLLRLRLLLLLNDWPSDLFDIRTN